MKKNEIDFVSRLQTRMLFLHQLNKINNVMCKRVLIVMVTMISFLFSCSVRREMKNGMEPVICHFQPSDTCWKSLTIREKIGQTMLMLPDREAELKLGGGTLESFFKLYPVTGFFMGWKLFTGVPEEKRVDFVRQSVLEYQSASKLPLIFQQDYESGVGLMGMTAFPKEMALGATNSPDLAYRYGKSVALECRSIGINWVLHPVADLNINPLNPIVNTRGISDDPQKAIRLLSKQIEGLQDNQIAATIKHFPGDGVDFRDQHLMTTTNSLPLKIWQNYHGKVFAELIKEGVACIMPGHITLPAYQQEKRDGFFLPATLSHELLTTLLKKEMGFKGVVVSDAMTMGGFRGWYANDLEGQVASFMAGVDVLLWPSYEYMDTVEARIQRGEISMERLNDAVQRVWAMKERLGLLDNNRELIRPITDNEKLEIINTSKEITERSITLVRDEDKKLPLSVKKDRKILLVAVTPKAHKGNDRDYKRLLNLRDEFVKKGFDVDFRRNILYENQGWKDNATDVYDKVIFLVARNTHTPFGPLQLWDDEAQSVWAANSMDKSKVIVISLGSPYVGSEYFERVKTYINTYSNDFSTHSALLKVLTGELPFKGISPVDLNYKIPMFN